MRVHLIRLIVLSAVLVWPTTGLGARALDPVRQTRINARVEAIKAWAADPTVVAGVKAVNAQKPAEYAAMTQEKWAELSVLDPFVRAFTKNDVAAVLRARRTAEVTEAFISATDGRKVAFLGKTTNWSHKGIAKHEVPMSGRPWQGQIEADDSTGVQQIQIGVPVLDRGKAIGSLVVGLSVSKLR
jgi:hypothetical protein